MKTSQRQKQTYPLKRIMGTTLARAIAVILIAVTVVEVLHFSYTLFFVQKKNQEIISEIAYSSIEEPIEQGGFVEANRRIVEMIKKNYFACASINAWDFKVNYCDQVKLKNPSVTHKEIRIGRGSEKIGDLFIHFDTREFIYSILFRLAIDVLLIIAVGFGLKAFFDLNSKKIYAQLDKMMTAVTRVSPESEQDTKDETGFDILEFDIVSKEISKKVRENIELSRSAAIARMTQMLAHDVRRPFSMLKMLLEGISKAKTPAQMQKFASTGIPETIRAMNSVNGLIQDVMEIGSNSEMFLSPVKPETLLEAALGDVFQTFPAAKVSISYEMKHTMHANVESGKVLRVFANILGNAVQAMNKEGTVRISTSNLIENDVAFVKFILANSGPFISADLLPKLFDAFFTNGKKGGTGLGLAIAHKIVTAHGGNIWCESSAGIGVEFHITLPATLPELTPDLRALPKSSQEITARFQAFGAASPDDDAEVQLELSIKNLLPRLGRRLSVLIVDDERIYRNSLTEGLTRHTELADLLEVVSAECSEDALALPCPDLAIVDVDLGPSSLSGFELVREMRNRGQSGLVCIHSNRISASDSKTAIAQGADAFLPKPMSRAHLLKLICQSLERLGLVAPVLASSGVDASASDPASTELETNTAAAQTLVSVLVDDMKTVRMSWEADWPIGTLMTFSCPEKFWSHVDANPGFLESLSCIVTDLNFGNLSPIDGGVFAQQIKLRTQIPVLIASNSTVRVEDFNGAADGVLGKTPPDRQMLESYLKKKS